MPKYFFNISDNPEKNTHLFQFQILLNRNRTTFAATRRILWALNTPIMNMWWGLPKLLGGFKRRKDSGKRKGTRNA